MSKSSRSASASTFAPTPFTEETEAVGLSRVLPLDDVNAERARSVALDVGRSLGALEVNATLFESVVEDALQASREGGRVRLQPENDALEPIYAEHVQILGKVTGVFRTL